MQTNKIVLLLENTLNPNLTREAQSTLLNSRQKEGFITQLLIIGDDKSFNISIRQSSLIFLKNALGDHYQKVVQIPTNDLQTLKSSILQALIRNCQQKSITPTIREIIYVLAQKQYPQNWQEIIPEIANNIQNSGDFGQLYGSIQALKAIVSAFGKSINQKMTLSNLCNKIVLPLLALCSKLFQNYNQSTSLILISIFKIFSTITYFHLPEMILMNMHSWMIFIKKLLDLGIESSNVDKNMYQLKKICLRILFRFYQRHMNRKYSDFEGNIINQFHQKYTKGIVESLLLQIMNQAQLTKNGKNRNFLELTKFSLSCLAYVYGQDLNAAHIVDIYRDKIIYICLERYRTRLNKNYSSYNEFSIKINEKRHHFCQFIVALLKNQARKNEKIAKGNLNYSNTDQVAKILGTLFQHIEKGDMEVKQLCLYIFSDISQILPQVDQQIQQKMQTFIVQYIKPLLKSGDTPPMIKLRCCEILAKYSYVQIPQNQVRELGQGVYGCLISNNSNHTESGSLDTFLQIHAVHAFNSLLRYDFIVNFTSPFLSNILQVYTSLLEIEVSIIKCLEDMLDKFETHLQPYGQGLIEMLSNMYFKYLDLLHKSQNNALKPNVYVPFKANKQQNNEQDEQYEDDDFDIEDNNQSIDNNYLTASKACIGAIRQIIQVPQFLLQKEQIVHNILISIFTDKEELFIEEGFNILNLVLFKQKEVRPEYNIYFVLIINGILPISNQLVEVLQKQNSDYSRTLLNMLQCICQQPDEDFIQNTIGCLRNYISKYQSNLRNQFDQAGTSFLDLIFQTVKYVHENRYQMESNKTATQSQRSMILTLYVSLIEWKVLNDNEMKQVIQTVSAWLNMEKEASRQNKINNSKTKSKFNQQSTQAKQEEQKLIYCPIYLQIILLASHFYPNVTLEVLNANWLVSQVLMNFQRFTCDYQISRILIGIGDLLSYQSINDQALSNEIMNRIPQLIEKQCKIRVGQQGSQMQNKDEEAQEEEKVFGMDQNTHIMGWKRQEIPMNNTPQKNNTNQEEMEEEYSSEEEEWEQEFNKYYESPLDNIDEIKYVFDILKSGNCSMYMSLMRVELQQKLSGIIVNTPSKFNNSN